MRILRACVVSLLLTGLLVTPAAATEGSAGPRWIGAWAAAVQRPTEFAFQPNWSVQGFANQTVRQVARVSVGGALLRVRLSNAYGTAPLRVAGVTVGKAGSGAAVRPGTLRPVTVGHRLSFAIPPGRSVASDPIPLPTAPLDRLAITLYFADPTGPATFHMTASATSYRAGGDHRFALGGAAFTETTQSFYYVSEVDTLGTPARASVVAFGDSITDGAFSSNDTDNRYPDELAERLLAARLPFGVLNAGISGNRVLEDSACFGDGPATRFARDVLSAPGVRSVIVLDGTNDLISIAQTEPDLCGVGHPDLTVEPLIAAHRAMIAAAHAHGIRIIGATLLPYKGNPYGAFTDRGEAIRDALNTWILTSGEYDAVVDFATLLADPNDPDTLASIYDGGDKIHPNDTGYHVMAGAINLAVL